MIKKLRVKFIAASMLALALVLLVILGGINVMSYRKTVSDADAILSVLASNQGMFPQRMSPAEDGASRKDAPGNSSMEDGVFRKRGFSDETPYESRFFSVLLDEAGRVLGTDTGKIAAVDQAAAAEYAQEVWRSGQSRGFWEEYRFIRSIEAGGIRIIFLDCGRSLSSFHAVLLASISISLLGLLAVLVLLILFSGRIVTPAAESYEKQRRFITDAGHELKTPLTIIGADADLLELEHGESEWLSDIKRQVTRLTGLTNDLVYLSRMDEERPQLQRIEFPLSDVAEEVVQSFQAPAKAQGKTLRMDIQPLLSFTGDEKAIRQLVSILLDNAVKYSPEGGTISVRLEKEGRFLKLAVSNTTARPIEQDQLHLLFDRFYRLDQSRSSSTGGYGLGMSIAQSIVAVHRGKIRADSPAENVLSVLVTLPQ
ncbi:MAG: HAMP domain-containing sensor histidine kinase [Dysosmobacter sp.]|nr:HAMP domain-containing sensor histidine kinase [Dysosmobacter sp.]